MERVVAYAAISNIFLESKRYDSSMSLTYILLDSFQHTQLPCRHCEELLTATNQNIQQVQYPLFYKNLSTRQFVARSASKLSTYVPRVKGIV